MVFVASIITIVGDPFQGTHAAVRSFLTSGSTINSARHQTVEYLKTVRNEDLALMQEYDPQEYDVYDYAIKEYEYKEEVFLSLIRREGYESVEIERCVIEPQYHQGTIHSEDK